jgi:hypothetical protein
MQVSKKIEREKNFIHVLSRTNKNRERDVKCKKKKRRKEEKRRIYSFIIKH